MSKIVPLFDYVLVEPIKKEKTESGLFIPDASQERTVALVVEVGTGRTSENGNLIPMMVHTGDVVYYSPNAGIAIDQNEKKYRLLRQVELYAKLEED